jgi:hypothetical protein
MSLLICLSIHVKGSILPGEKYLYYPILCSVNIGQGDQGKRHYMYDGSKRVIILFPVYVTYKDTLGSTSGNDCN